MDRCGGHLCLERRGDAREFLSTPHPKLEGRTSLDVALTELGARRVEELLWNFYGPPA